MGLIDEIKLGKVDESDLLEYVTSNDVDVAIAVASSKMATLPIIDIAAHYNDRRVRLAVITNKNIGNDTVLFLCDDKDDEVYRLARAERERRNI